MARKKRIDPGKARAKETFRPESLIYGVICVAVLVIPLVVSVDGLDSFRLPKELAFRAEMIVLVALLAALAVLGRNVWRGVRWKHPGVLFPIVITAWTAVATLTSTNRDLSVPALLYAAGACLVFVATLLVAGHGTVGMLRWVAWAGLINALLYVPVALSMMPNPIRLSADLKGHQAATGLLGNANDLGTALLPIVIASTAAAVATRRHRIFFIATATASAIAVLASVSVAATGALLVALITLAFVVHWKRALVISVAGIVAMASIVLLHGPLRHRLSYMVKSAKTAEWDKLSNGRLSSFAAALEMFEDHPLTGIGPGTFGWQYYPYKLEVSERNQALLEETAGARYNFEEVHNDHLEVLAETGAPGYALFLAALVFLASGSLRRRRPETEEDPRSRFARVAQLPLVVGIGVLALAQYPLQLTSSLSTVIFLAAICTAWRDDIDPLTREEDSHNA